MITEAGNTKVRRDGRLRYRRRRRRRHRRALRVARRRQDRLVTIVQNSNFPVPSSTSRLHQASTPCRRLASVRHVATRRRLPCRYENDGNAGCSNNGASCSEDSDCSTGNTCVLASFVDGGPRCGSTSVACTSVLWDFDCDSPACQACSATAFPICPESATSISGVVDDGRRLGAIEVVASHVRQRRGHRRRVRGGTDRQRHHLVRKRRCAAPDVHGIRHRRVGDSRHQDAGRRAGGGTSTATMAWTSSLPKMQTTITMWLFGAANTHPTRVH